MVYLYGLRRFICLQHLGVHHQVEGAGAVRSQLTQDDILSHSTERIYLCVEGSREQDLDRFLERALSEGAGVDSVDTMPRDGREDAPGGHDVAEGGQVTIVDIDIICAKHEP